MPQRHTSSLFRELEPRIAALVKGVAATPVPADNEPIPDLEGSDNGLYPRLCKLATALGELVADDDERTNMILVDGKKGLRYRMYTGMTLFVREGSPLDMTNTLAHEHSHRYSPRVRADDLAGGAQGETVAEGTAAVVCGYFGLDTSPFALPYLARHASHTNGVITPRLQETILYASANLIRRIEHIT